MKIEGPERYSLTISPASFTSRCEQGTSKFSGLATSLKPKLYVVSSDHKPIYVGMTKRPIRDRLRVGWKANGETGYYGYAWRHHFPNVLLDVWAHVDPPETNSCLDIETIEAEVVWLIRASGQWPRHQTEIHFHASTDEHRAAARTIMSRYQP
jgi:hypothetical protein